MYTKKFTYTFIFSLLLLVITNATSYADNVSDVIIPPKSNSKFINFNNLVKNHDLTENEYYLIDVLFLYSKEVGALNNNLNDKVSEIVATANETFRNSGLKLLVRSVGIKESPEKETGDAENELKIIQKSEEIKALRETYKADVVSFLVSHTSDNKHCGVAYLLENMNEFSSLYAYQIVSLNSVCENWVFTHELGHNLGAHHDLPNSGSGGLFSYSLGYKFDLGFEVLRTVMAFGPGRVINYFSSETVKYENQNIGDENTDNTKTINNSMALVANYKGDSKTKLLPKISLSINTRKKQCRFTTNIENLPSNSKLDIYQINRRKKLKKLRTITANKNNITFRLKRRRKKIRLYSEIKYDGEAYKSNILTCRKRK